MNVSSCAPLLRLRRRRWASFVAAAALAAAGCSSSGSTDPTPAVGGSGGSSGAGTDASMDAKAGSAGTAGSAGKGGSGGVGGTAGAAGTQDSGLDADASADTSLDVSQEAEAGQAGSGGGSDATASCLGNTDCVGNIGGPYCDTQSGKCVQCTLTDTASCQTGMYCDAGTLTCAPGCDTIDDCTSGVDAGATTCDVTSHKCVGCADDNGCPLGQVCKAGACEAGCTQQHGCQSGYLCCTSKCINTSTDVQNCGACGAGCQLPNATAACLGGKCGMDACLAGFENCDQNPANGCETPSADGGSCSCTPGATQACYSGPAGTQGVGVCKGGTQTCNSSGSGWSGCVGEVIPTSESCYTPGDDNCNGQTNESGSGCTCLPNEVGNCYTGPTGTEGVGVCKAGTRTCNAAGTSWGTCNNQVLPTPETCLTPVDDNCNGQVNESGGAGCQCTPNATANCYGGPPGTEGVGVCKAGTQTCDALGTGFGPCNGSVVPSADICTDNLDNDCNGVLNDGLSSNAAGCICFPAAVATCYSGSPSTLNVGPCKSGTAQCNAQGSALGTCNGEVIPVVDDCSDSIDNDCNGIVNDGFGKGGVGCGCIPGAQQDCYSGAAGTLGKGVCIGGKQTCGADGKAFGPCIGEIIPDIDSCLNSVDDDCNGVVNDGFGKGGAGCACLPGSATACYEGATGTQGVGPCKGGTSTCNAMGTGKSGCVGQVLPIDEICANGINDDCVGGVDDPPDADADGWNKCNGDCCENVTQCGSPAQVNPGAFEVQGDNVDNNCNGTVDENPFTTCSTAANFSTDVTAAKALLLLNAMEICQMSANNSWGIIPGSYNLTRADGTGTPDYRQVGIMNQFGTDASNLPKAGSTLTALSSGRARDATDPDPTNGTGFTYAYGAPPPDFVAPHGGQLPNTSPSCPIGSGANDSVRLRVQLKVPTNANSFSFQFRFYSQEYWTYTCTQWNDFFIAMLNSAWVPGAGQTAIPADKNISFDGNGSYISVNSQQFFTVCTTKTGYPCPNGTAGLAGTGYAPLDGGATTWLTTTSPVKPGETITLRFVIWDTSDAIYDSLVLLDNFRWSASPSNGPITTQ